MKKLAKKIINFIFMLLSLKNYIIFESSPDYTDNSFALYQYFLKKNLNQKYRIIWFLNNNESDIPRVPNVTYVYRNKKDIINTLSRLYYEYTAKYIIDSNIYVHPKREDQKRIYLGHGMPLKISREYCKHAGNMTLTITTSSFFNDIYCDIFSIDNSKISATGFPRNDVLLEKNMLHPLKTNCYKDKKLIFWMPTYRQHKSNKNYVLETNNIGIPCIANETQLEQLNQLLEKMNIIMLFRPHPAQDLSFIHIKELNNIVLATDPYLKKNKLSLYELLAITDALLTDYSSVYYDYLLTDNPIGLTVDDLDVFFKTFDCPFSDYKSNIKGCLIKNFSELTDFIEKISFNEDQYKQERNIAKEKYHTYFDNQSCKRLYDYLISEYDL